MGLRSYFAARRSQKREIHLWLSFGDWVHRDEEFKVDTRCSATSRGRITLASKYER